jgi:hypothetical protein
MRHSAARLRLRTARLCLVLLAVVTLWTPFAAGDVFHIKGGGLIEGRLVTVEDDQYQIRTLVGTVRLPVAAVERVENAPTPFDEYDQRRAAAQDTPVDQTALAAWCGEQGLKAEERTHLQRALELNPNYAPARQALGYTRVGALWVDARHVVQRKPKDEPTSAPAGDPEKLAEAIQSQWCRRLQAACRLLDSTQDRLVEQGRRTILEARDPLAILPLTQVLSDGDLECRQLLVQSLATFPQDEATMNLAILVLLDPSAAIRADAISELVRRQDPRVVAQYRAALRSGNDTIIRRAAFALGRFGAKDAVPDLIDALTARRNRWVEVPVQTCVRPMRNVFTAPIEVYLGPDGHLRAWHVPEIGFGDFIYNINNELQYREVTVFRTEVQEALQQLTGQNFGFERDQWRRWYQESMP